MSSSARRRKSTASTNPDTVETPQLSVPGSSRMRTPTTSARSDTSPARPTSPRASSPDAPRPPTAAERARERKLRADPLADVLGPLYIDCLRCGTHIKLSPKSAYDPFHWTKHRERCLRRPAAVVAEMLREARNPASPSSLSTLSSAPSSRASASAHAASSPTPPLTPDADQPDDADTSSLSALSSAPSAPAVHSSPFSSPPPKRSRFWLRPAVPEKIPCVPAAHQEPNARDFEAYLHRSRRRPSRLAEAESWQDWSWSRLVPPVWVLAEYPSGTPAVDDDDASSSAQDMAVDAPVPLLTDSRLGDGGGEGGSGLVAADAKPGSALASNAGHDNEGLPRSTSTAAGGSGLPESTLALESGSEARA